jgi:molecular chaperone DnaK
VEFDLELTRDQVAEVAEPYILRAVKIAKKVLAEKHVGILNVDRVILVGGPTLAPYFREILSDPVAGLGIPLDYSVNPITVVAKGAALFAGTQALERGSSQGRSLAAKKAEGKFVIEFVDYKSIGPELEPLVGGRVTAPFAQSLEGFTLEFCNQAARPPWISGRITLEASGAFMTQLFAVKGSETVFTIKLYDAQGKPVPIEPNEISYTQGPGGVSDVPLIHDIRYETSDGKAPPIISKGTPIPTVVGFDARQVNPVKKGSKDTWIRIPIVEGPSDRANRNNPIGCFEKSGEDLKGDLPAGSELEVKLEMDASRTIKIYVYIPLLDQGLEASFNFGAYGAESLASLQEELVEAERRLDQLRDKAAKTAEPEAWSALEKIETDEMVENAERTLEEAAADPKEMMGQGKKHVKELVIALDEVEDKLAWPALVAESAEAYQYTEGTVSKWGTAEQRQALPALRGELDKAIAAKDIYALKQKVDQLYALAWSVNSTRFEWWEGWYDYLKKQKHRMTDQAAASQWIRQGDRAL